MPESRSLILDGRTWAEVSLDCARQKISTPCRSMSARRHHLRGRQGRRLRTRRGRVRPRARIRGRPVAGSNRRRRRPRAARSWRQGPHPADDRNLEGRRRRHRRPESYAHHLGTLAHRDARTRGAQSGKRFARSSETRHGHEPSRARRREALPRLCEMLSACQHLRLEGVSTHFASAEVLDAEDARAPDEVLRRGACGACKIAACIPALVHMGNSAAMSARPETWKTMVRPGIALYGYSLAFTRGGETCSGRGPAAASCAFVEDASADSERRCCRTSRRLHGHIRDEGTEPHCGAARRLRGRLSSPAFESRAGHRRRGIRAGRGPRLHGPDYRRCKPHQQRCGGR